MSWASGLLGGLMGAGSSVTEIADNRLKQLADKLKMEAEAELRKAEQERGFKHAEGMQGAAFKHAEGLFEKNQTAVDNRTTAANLREDTRTAAQNLREDARDSVEDSRWERQFKLMEDKAKQQEWPIKKKDALVEAGKVIDHITKEKIWEPGTEIPPLYRDRINALLTGAGLQPMQEGMELKDKNWFQRVFGLDAGTQTGYRLLGDGSQEAPPPGSATTVAQADNPQAQGNKHWQQFADFPAETPNVQTAGAGGLLANVPVDQPPARMPKEEVKTPKKVEPIGELSEGVQFGRSDKGGYVILEDGKPRPPSEDEMKQILQHVQGNPRMGGDPIKIPYSGPAGGYYNPEHYKNFRGLPGVKGAR